MASAGELKSVTADAKPISGGRETRAHRPRVQMLMSERKVAALLIEPGSTLDYFTGIRWPPVPSGSPSPSYPPRGEVLGRDSGHFEETVGTRKPCRVGRRRAAPGTSTRARSNGSFKVCATGAPSRACLAVESTHSVLYRRRPCVRPSNAYDMILGRSPGARLAGLIKVAGGHWRSCNRPIT